MLAEGCAAAVWTVLRHRSLATRAKQLEPNHRAAGAAAGMGLLAVAEVAARRWSILVPGSLLLEAAGFEVIAAGVLVTGAATELCEVYATQGQPRVVAVRRAGRGHRPVAPGRRRSSTSDCTMPARPCSGYSGPPNCWPNRRSRAGQEPLHRLDVGRAVPAELCCSIQNSPIRSRSFRSAEALEPVLDWHIGWPGPTWKLARPGAPSAGPPQCHRDGIGQPARPTPACMRPVHGSRPDCSRRRTARST